MQGKICVVTGATSGIGEQIAIELSRRGAQVGIVGRNPKKLEASAALLSSQPDVLTADLSLLSEVRRLADELHAKYDHIDVLVNNAGIHDIRAATTAEGFDRMLATNYLAPFLLTNLVRDLLEAASAARVVVTASEAHRLANPVKLDRLAQPGSYSGPSAQLAYGNSKLLDLLWTLELGRRLEGTGVTANCFCPGAVNTGLIGSNPVVNAGGAILSRTPLIRRPDQGARMGIRLACDAEFDGVTGKFFSSTPGARLMPPIKARKDADLQRRLWERTEELVGVSADSPAAA